MEQFSAKDDTCLGLISNGNPVTYNSIAKEIINDSFILSFQDLNTLTQDRTIPIVCCGIARRSCSCLLKQ